MKASRNLVTADGRTGTIDPAQIPDTGTPAKVNIELEDGQKVVVPFDVLEEREDGSYYLPYPLQPAEMPGEDSASLTIPVIEERLKTGRRRVETGRVRISKEVHAEEITVDEPGFEEEIEVERVQVNLPVGEHLEPRQEGDTLIIPLIEEVIVVEKRLVLREEVHITRRRREVRDPKTVTLRREEVRIEGSEPDEAG